MKKLIIGATITLLGASIAYANFSQPRGSYYLQVNDLGGSSYDVHCSNGDAVVGVAYDDTGDDSVTALYCKNVQSYDRYNHSRYVHAKGRGGSIYPVQCDWNEYISGVRYKNTGDDTVLGIYCSGANPQELELENSNYVQLNDLNRGHNYSVYCYDNQAMTGIQFENADDDSMIAFYCSDTY